MGLDPEQPLPGAPEPWAASVQPSLRDGPPYVMSEMIEAEPALAERLVRRLTPDPAMRQLTGWIAGAAEARAPVTLTGCGTSEHAALAGALLLGRALGAQRSLVRAAQALDLVREPQDDGIVVAVSHEGGTPATNDAIRECRRAGARTALVTVSRRSPGAREAEIVIETGEQDQSWCHTVGYLSPVVACAVLSAALDAPRPGGGRPGGTATGGEMLDGTALRALLEAAADQRDAAADVAGALDATRRIIVCGAGPDLVAARELALKLEEGARLPSVAMHLETVRHGHLAAADATTGLILIQTDAGAGSEPVRERSASVLRAVRALGMPAAAILGARLGVEIPLELAPAGRLVVPDAHRLDPVAGRILGTALPIQLLALSLAMARGRNPDPIGRDDPRQALAAEA